VEDTRVAKAFNAVKLEALRKALSPSRPTGGWSDRPRAERNQRRPRPHRLMAWLRS